MRAATALCAVVAVGELDRDGHSGIGVAAAGAVGIVWAWRHGRWRPKAADAAL